MNKSLSRDSRDRIKIYIFFQEHLFVFERTLIPNSCALIIAMYLTMDKEGPLSLMTLVKPTLNSGSLIRCKLRVKCKDSCNVPGFS